MSELSFSVFFVGNGFWGVGVNSVRKIGRSFSEG